MDETTLKGPIENAANCKIKQEKCIEFLLVWKKKKKKKGIKNRTTLQGDWKTVCNQTSWEELRGPESLEDKSEEAVW